MFLNSWQLLCTKFHHFSAKQPFFDFLQKLDLLVLFSRLRTGPTKVPANVAGKRDCSPGPVPLKISLHLPLIFIWQKYTKEK